MIVAFDENTKAIAMELEKHGYSIVNLKEAPRYDCYIYKRYTPHALLSMIDHNENVFLLNVSGKTAGEVARILKSHLKSAYVDTHSYF
jgi:hypothetical protein